MINAITSDLATFKTLKFGSGLNILLADKSEGATDRQSRNGAGKSSFVEIVHFLLGADADKDSIFRNATLLNHSFYMDFTLAGSVTMVGRSGQKPADVNIVHGNTERWPVQPRPSKSNRGLVLPNARWREVLGSLIFGLDVNEEEVSRFEPRFRQLFAYFARKQASGAFQSHLSQSTQQQDWDIQLALSYLIGLDWTVPKRFQEVRAREKTIRELRNAIKEGSLGGFLGTVAELRTKVTIADARARRLQTDLESFQVVPEYSDLEREANTLTSEIAQLSNANTTDRALMSRLEESLRLEAPPGITQLEQVYAEAGIVLPEKIVRRFDDVVKFHQAIVDNRQAHLKSELEQTEKRIVDRERQMGQKDERRSQIMRILQAGGALEHYTRLQEELSRSQAEVEALRRNLELAEEVENRKTTAAIERKQLYQRLQQDHHEQRETITEAILTFEELSSALYEKAGHLTISATENGPKFDVTIEASRSLGINNMQIFCFDMMITILSQRRGRGPGFLIHDSHLFDGVDERQIAKALQLGAEKAEQYGFQYIVTMNSDDLPTEGFQNDFDIQKHVVEPRLTDKTDTGGLFGVRF